MYSFNFICIRLILFVSICDYLWKGNLFVDKNCNLCSFVDKFLLSVVKTDSISVVKRCSLQNRTIGDFFLF